jgi:hypothetical protein
MSREFGARPIRATPTHPMAQKHFIILDNKVINMPFGHELVFHVAPSVTI